MIPIFSLSKGQALPARVTGRSQLEQANVRDTVLQVLDHVKQNKDAALYEYTQRFDGVDLRATGLRVSKEELALSYKAVPSDMLQTIRLAISNITAFHEKQMEKSWIDFDEGKALGQLINPIAAVGVYVPGGTAPLSSSVLMNVLPAKVAGVSRIVMATPPDKQGKVNPFILVAAAECGVDEIYKVGGAQAIAALAYGTESIKKVDKITGPGNIYVANAKKEVYGVVGIDMIAGPSEVLVIADDSANPRFVAADLLSQAEHDTQAAAILVTTDEGLAKAVQLELKAQLAALPRAQIAQSSIGDNGVILLAQDIEHAFAIANEIAPEHLELCIRDAFSQLGRVKNAGACFVGNHSPEPLGDYVAGPNHVLPTSGTARFFSPLTVQDFIKRTSVIAYDAPSLAQAAPHIERFALAEELHAHARAVTIRFEEDAPCEKPQ